MTFLAIQTSPAGLSSIWHSKSIQKLSAMIGGLFSAHVVRWDRKGNDKVSENHGQDKAKSDQLLTRDGVQVDLGSGLCNVYL